MAATSQPLATQAAVEILKKNGTAVDAAIAANAVLGLVEPASCGIGGDLFAIVWDPKTKKLHGLNASGRSPQSLTLAHFKTQGLEKIPSEGPLPVSVPGCVDGWFELHKKFGRLPVGTILAPAISYAREGFPVTPVIAEEWARSSDRVGAQPGFKRVFMPDGHAPETGEIFRNVELAATIGKTGGGRNRGVLQRRDRAIDCRVHEGAGRISHGSRPRRPQVGVGRTDLDELSWLRCLGIAAEHARARRIADAQHPRRL